MSKVTRWGPLLKVERYYDDINDAMVEYERLLPLENRRLELLSAGRVAVDIGDGAATVQYRAVRDAIQDIKIMSNIHY